MRVKQPADVVTDDDLRVLRAFHGHLGPYAVAGLRAGRHALAVLGVSPHFGIEAEVWCPGAPPPSCFVDGIQISTGCTMGKANIRHHVSEDVALMVRDKKAGRSVRIVLRPDTIARAVKLMRSHNDEAGAAVIRQVPFEELAETTIES